MRANMSHPLNRNLSCWMMPRSDGSVVDIGPMSNSTKNDAVVINRTAMGSGLGAGSVGLAPNGFPCVHWIFFERGGGYWSFNFSIIWLIH